MRKGAGVFSGNAANKASAGHFPDEGAVMDGAGILSGDAPDKLRGPSRADGAVHKEVLHFSGSEDTAEQSLAGSVTCEIQAPDAVAASLKGTLEKLDRRNM